MRIPKGGIAFFDSGIGGLTVLAECRKFLPKGIFYYYGDNGHAPYGNLPRKKIRKYVFRIFRKFKRLQVQAAVVACNTVTAVCIEELRSRFPFPIIGTEPAVMTAAARGGEIFVLSTRATYESERFTALCARARKRYPQADIKAYPCDGLAGAIERQVGRWEKRAEGAEKGFDCTPYLPRGKPNVVVLGCTHYIYMAEAIREYYGCEAVDGNYGIFLQLKKVLAGAEGDLTEKKRSTKEAQPPLSHSQPPRRKISPKTPETPLKKEGKRGRKGKLFSQKFYPKNTENSPSVVRIFFLGRAKKQNFCVFKQMFGQKWL